MKSASSEGASGLAQTVLPALGNVALVCMAGSLWVVGYMVAPTLFAILERERAGQVAGQLFTHVAWIVMSSASLLIALRQRFWPGAPRWAIACLVAILALAVAGHFGLRPYMADLKDAHAAGQLVQEAYRSAFGRAHGVSALLYLAQSVLAAVVVAAWRRQGAS